MHTPQTHSLLASNFGFNTFSPRSNRAHVSHDASGCSLHSFTCARSTTDVGMTKLLATRSGGQRSGQRLLARTASRKDSADVISCSTEPAWILNTHTYARVRNMKVQFHARLIHLLVTVCVGRRLSQGGVLVARNTFTLATAREAKGTTEGAGAAVEAHVPWRT